MSEPRRSAVVLVDNQNDYVHPSGRFTELDLNGFSGAEDYAAFVAATNALTESARAHGIPVIHVPTRISSSYLDSALSPFWSAIGFSREGGLVVEGGWGAAIPDDIVVADTDEIVIKKGHSAFAHSNLDRLLRELEVDTILLAGGAVGGCLADTTTQGAALGYQQYIVADCSYPRSGLPAFVPDRQVGLTTIEELRRSFPREQPGDAPPGDTVLVLVDCQEEMLGLVGMAIREELADPAQLTAATDALVRLAGCAVANSTPVVAMTTRVRRDGLDSGFPRTPVGARMAGSFVTDVVPAAFGDVIDTMIRLRKSGSSAFAGTGLDRVLRNLGARDVVLAGGDSRIGSVVTDTVRDGCALGYRMSVVTDTTFPTCTDGLHGAERRSTLITQDDALRRLGGLPGAPA